MRTYLRAASSNLWPGALACRRDAGSRVVLESGRVFWLGSGGLVRAVRRDGGSGVTDWRAAARCPKRMGVAIASASGSRGNCQNACGARRLARARGPAGARARRRAPTRARPCGAPPTPKRLRRNFAGKRGAQADEERTETPRHQIRAELGRFGRCFRTWPCSKRGMSQAPGQRPLWAQTPGQRTSPPWVGEHHRQAPRRAVVLLLHVQVQARRRVEPRVCRSRVYVYICIYIYV